MTPTLTDEEMEAVRAYLVDGDTEISVVTVDRPPPDDGSGGDTAASNDISCKGQTVTIKHKSPAQITLWKFISDTEWCV